MLFAAYFVFIFFYEEYVFKDSTTAYMGILGTFQREVDIQMLYNRFRERLLTDEDPYHDELELFEAFYEHERLTEELEHIKTGFNSFASEELSLLDSPDFCNEI